MRVLFAAGGTGGHINPAIAIAQEIKKRNPDAQILFVGTKDKMEATLVPKAGFDIKFIDVSGFQRSFAPSDIIYNINALKKLLFVTGKCKKIIKEFKPDVAIGFGGYVSGPVLRAAHKMGIKIAIHEQNAYPGKTNIALSHYAEKVMLTVDNAQKYLKNKNQSIITGLPVRDEILLADKKSARKKLAIAEDKLMILSTGGSLGAKAINDVMLEVLKKYCDKDIIFVHGFGKSAIDFPEKLKSVGVDLNQNKNLIVNDYIYNMADYLAAADFVIGRAGASSLAEIQVLGKASLLVPYPFASENHQYYNALALADKDAAFLVEQKNFNIDSVSEILDKLILDKKCFENIERNVRNMAVCDAKKKICDIVLSLIN